ncbi:NAD(P)/FAD-dependent oxidoreductase [Pyrobaculum calidifontis]|uniref:NAD(P)/FAD-dependent oxidoreductase n=1 Tax=Pyrobaculum calidifontis TaxID=181486 RepID=UPI000321E7FF|nr:FAD/NAD(P)-binding oxidoreductase [Pyrobaculum calidifontis]
MKRIAVLGGGTGGLIVANLLARNLRREIVKGEVDLMLFDKSNTYILEAGLLPYVAHAFDEEDLKYNKRTLLDPVIKYYTGPSGTITYIDLKNRKFKTQDGKEYSYDYLVIALGCTYDISQPPGLKDDYHTYYEFEKAKELREMLERFTGGSIVQMVYMPDVPIKCPIASGKGPLLIDSYLSHVRRLRGKYMVTVVTTVDHLHAQPEVNKVLEERLRERGHTWIYNFEPSEVDPKKKEVIATNGERVKYDLLITIPLHRGPEVIKKSEIGDPYGFLPGDRYTLTYRRGKEHYDEVYIVGDVANIGVARAGAVAHYEAYVVAHNIASEVKGFGDKILFFGEVICPYLETAYTPYDKGRAWMPWWTYAKNARPFVGTTWGWYLMRTYYLTIPLTLRGLI